MNATSISQGLGSVCVFPLPALENSMCVRLGVPCKTGAGGSKDVTKQEATVVARARSLQRPGASAFLTQSSVHVSTVCPCGGVVWVTDKTKQGRLNFHLHLAWLVSRSVFVFASFSPDVLPAASSAPSTPEHTLARTYTSFFTKCVPKSCTVCTPQKWRASIVSQAKNQKAGGRHFFSFRNGRF